MPGRERVPSFQLASGTTDERDGSYNLTTVGSIFYNTTTKRIEFRSEAGWVSIMPINATGGTVTYDSGYRIHTFTTSDTFIVIGSGEIEYLIVAGGGGGGGRDIGGGGGAGEVKMGNTMINPGSYSVIVGAGGAGLTDSSVAYSTANKGNVSSFNSILCDGGGAGRTYNRDGGVYINGGSGGGGSGRPNNYPDRTSGGTTTGTGQGNNGGSGEAQTPATYGGGGGGGAGQTGRPANLGRHGGYGVASSISGTSTHYAGGGGGAGHRSSGNRSEGDGGLGGGGYAGNTSDRHGTNGLGGGGGASRNTGLTGGDGGDGIVIIRYLI